MAEIENQDLLIYFEIGYIIPIHFFEVKAIILTGGELCPMEDSSARSDASWMRERRDRSSA